MKAALASVLLFACVARAAEAPATAPAVDYSSPKAVLHSWAVLVLAGDIDAFEKCVVPGATQQERDIIKYIVVDEIYSDIIAAAALQHFGLDKAKDIASNLVNTQSMLPQIDASTETMTGDEGKILPAPLPEDTKLEHRLHAVDARKINGQWRLSFTYPKIDDTRMTRAKAKRDIYDLTLKELRDGAFATVADMQAKLAERLAALDKQP